MITQNDPNAAPTAQQQTVQQPSETQQLPPTQENMADMFLRDALIADMQAPPAQPAYQYQPPAQPAYQYQQPAYQQPVAFQQAPAQPPAVPPVNQPRPFGLIDDPEKLVKAAGLTDEERETYQASITVIDKIVKAQMNPLMSQLQEMDGMARAAVQANEMDFVGRVRDQVPAMEQIVNDPRWTAFLQTNIPGTPFRYLDSLSQAHNSRDLQSVVSTFSAFMGGQRQQPPQPPMQTPYNAQPPQQTPGYQPPMQQRVVPQTGTGGSPVSANGGKQMLKWSVYEQASSEYTKGNMPRDQFMKVRALYEPALSEGRVNYNM